MERVSELLATRGVDKETVYRLQEVDKERRELIQTSEQLKSKRNEVSKQIAEKKRNKESADDVIQQMQEVSKEIKNIDEKLRKIEQEFEDISTGLPNLPHESIPVGESEDDNEEISRWGDEFLGRVIADAKPHWEVGEALGILDFKRGAKVSQSRVVYFICAGGRLERGHYKIIHDIGRGGGGGRVWV